MDTPEINKLREDSRIVLRYWRTVENWGPADIDDAKNMLLAAVNAGGNDLQDAINFYAEMANKVRPLVIDQAPLSVSIPPHLRPAAAKNQGNNQSQMSFA